MQFQDVKPTAFSDPSSHWRNETNAYDGNLTTFADNQPKPKIPNYVQFSGQTINLGANEAIFCIRLTLKLGTTGFVNDTWEVKLINGTTTRRLWNGIISITDPTTFEWEVLANILTTDGLWTKANDENYIVYNNFNEDNNTRHKVRNLTTNEERVVSLASLVQDRL